MVKNWYKKNNGEVQHAFFGEPKEHISTTIPRSLKNFAIERNLKFNIILAEGIKDFMGEGIQDTKQQLKEKIRFFSERYTTLQNMLYKSLGDEATDKILKEVEEMINIKERLRKEGKSKE